MITLWGISSAAFAAEPGGRKCPADKVTICGHDILDVLKMMGAKRLEGATDKHLKSYVAHFDRTDTDKDGRHSKKEYIEDGKFMNPMARRGIFGAADNNADGFVTRVEYVLNRIITDEAKKIVQGTDANKDGKITREEFIGGIKLKDIKLSAAIFDALDTKKDGTITIPEYLRVWGGWARPNYREQEKKLAARLEKPEKKEVSAADLFKLIDVDGNGKVTKSELDSLFGGADTNCDENMTLKELVEWAEKE